MIGLFRRSKRKQEQDGPAQASGAAAEGQAKQPGPKRDPSPSPSVSRQLWGREFKLAESGLAPDEVVQFVEKLKGDYEARLKEKAESTAWDSFSRQVLAEAEREAARIKLRAKQDVEVEASRMVAEARHQAQEITDRATRRAQELTEKGVQEILTSANKKAQLTETRARQLSQLMLIRAREDIQDHITAEVQSAYHKLNSLLDDLVDSAKSIESQWKDKTLELWSSPALAEAEEQGALLGSGQIGVLSDLSAPPAQEEERAAAPEEERQQDALPAEPEPEARAAPRGERAGERKGKRTHVPTPEPPRPVRREPKARAAPAELGTRPVLPVDAAGMPQVGGGGAATGLLVGAEEEEEASDLLAPEVSATVDIAKELLSEPQEGEGAYTPSQSGQIVETPEEPVDTERSPTGDEHSTPSLEEVLKPKEAEEVEGKRSQFKDLYSGEVDLVLAPPVDFNKVSQLYSHLQSLTELRVLHTAGSWEQGTVVTVLLDKPGPLISLLKRLPSVAAKPISSDAGGLLKGTMGSLGERGRKRQRVGIVFEEAPSAKGGQEAQVQGPANS